VAARLGAERAAGRFGAQVTHYVPEHPDDPQEQSELIGQALAMRPDAFVLSPVHPTRVNPAIERIAAAGIPMVGFINPIPVGRSVSYVGADDAQLARELADYLFRHLEGTGTVLIVGGPAQSVTSIDRLRGFMAAAAERPRIRIVGELAGDYARPVAQARTAGWLREHDAPDACLVANDIMALGVIDALEAARRHALVLGVNAIPQAIAAIGAGRMLATADFNAMQMACLATECALRHLQGEAVPRRVELPVRLIHRANWREWDRPYEERSLATLAEIGAA
jgi:ribose transport system substrate-binding protein